MLKSKYTTSISYFRNTLPLPPVICVINLLYISNGRMADLGMPQLNPANLGVYKPLKIL